MALDTDDLDPLRLHLFFFIILFAFVSVFFYYSSGYFVLLNVVRLY